MKTLRRHAARLAAALALLAPCAHAQTEPVGYVKTVTGEATVRTDGQSVKAAPGVPVRAGSELRTEAGATLGVALKDNTLLSFGPNTQFTVENFAYAPAEGRLGLTGGIARGTLGYVSGIIAKLRPEAVQLRTPSGMIGVRGTEFAVKVEQQP